MQKYQKLFLRLSQITRNKSQNRPDTVVLFVSSYVFSIITLFQSLLEEFYYVSDTFCYQTLSRSNPAGWPCRFPKGNLYLSIRDEPGTSFDQHCAGSQLSEWRNASKNKSFPVFSISKLNWATVSDPFWDFLTRIIICHLKIHFHFFLKSIHWEGFLSL